MSPYDNKMTTPPPDEKKKKMTGKERLDKTLMRKYMKELGMSRKEAIKKIAEDKAKKQKEYLDSLKKKTYGGNL